MTWNSFQDTTLYTDSESPADNILEDICSTFNLPSAGISVPGDGGTLRNVDLKRVNPIAAAKASCLEGLAYTESLTEFAVNEDGKVYTYSVGDAGGNMKVYYTIKSAGYIPSNVGVMVTGGKPKPRRIVSGWIPLIGPSADNTIWNTRYLATGGECMVPGITQQAVVTYKDFVAESGAATYNDGVKNVFELSNPWQRIAGWAWRVDPNSPTLIKPTTEIKQQAQSNVLMMVDALGVGIVNDDKDPGFAIGIQGPHPNIGQPQQRSTIIRTGDPSIDSCFTFDEDVIECGRTTLDITIPMVEDITYETVRGVSRSKFRGIGQVMLVGIKLQKCIGIPKDNTAGLSGANTKDNTNLFISASQAGSTLFRLQSQEQYVVVYNEDDDPTNPTPCIQFAANSRWNDNGSFGTAVDFFVDPNSTDLVNAYGGYTSGTAIKGKGTVLPTNNDGGGVLVQQVWVELALDTASFIVNDPNGSAYDIATNLRVDVTPIVLEDIPAPVAYNGTLVDQSLDIQDNDPTTVQNFTQTPMEVAYEAISSGRSYQISLASIDESGTVSLSRNLYNILTKDTGMSYKHVCDPTSEPKLGGAGQYGGIVNTIEYNYSDQGTYLINVTEGPEAFGDFAGIDGGIYYKRVENIQAQGTIIQDLGNHVDFKVRVDGYGDLYAFNGQSSILTNRDRVAVTIYNNEVEG